MRIYNTLKRQKEPLVPLSPNQVKMYTCGQTVYNDIHMGNARFYVVFDAVRRYLAYKGYNVEYVQNFTDIEDKIIQRAIDEGCTTEEIAQKYITRTKEDIEALNVLPATVNPRATEEIPEIITLITHLIEGGFAYEDSGTVYYEVSKFEGYGKLSRKKVEDLEAGARVEVDTGKRSPADFVLWKPAKPNEPKWQSPWGDGRPGWHIECSAMAKKYLGDEIDIHGGGEDLIFPHHENEIAQTEAITKRDLARCWMHCGILTTDHRKMSKSRGNFFTLREAAEKISDKFPGKLAYEVIRFYLLSGHYRMPMEFGDLVLAAAGQGLQRIKTCYANLQHAIEIADSDVTAKATEKNALPSADMTDGESVHMKDASVFSCEFMYVMDDDFNTADAITVVFELVKFINIRLAESSSHTRAFLVGLQENLGTLCGILGFDLNNPKSEAGGEIDTLVAARQEARKTKNFAEADRIRDELTKMGIVLEDTPDGVRWRRG